MYGAGAVTGEDFVDHGPAFHLLNRISACLSIIGSLSVIFAFIGFPRLRRYFARLALYLALSDLWLCSSMLMGQSRAPHYAKCQVQSLMGSYFGLASILWTVAIADSLRRVLLERDLRLETKYESRLHLMAWGLPCAAVLLIVGLRVSGPAGLTCWIQNTATGTVVRMITFYLPLWVSIVYAVWVYWRVSTLMRRLLAQRTIDGSAEYESSVWEYQQDIERQSRSMKMLLLIPLVMAFCWTPSSIRRVIDIVVPDWSCTPLDYLCVIFSPMQGALNALIYGLTPAVRDALFGRLDHSARKLRGVQRRLRSLRPGRGRKSARFQHLAEASPEAAAELGAAPTADAGLSPQRRPAALRAQPPRPPAPVTRERGLRAGASVPTTAFGRPLDDCDDGLGSELGDNDDEDLGAADRDAVDSDQMTRQTSSATASTDRGPFQDAESRL